MDPIPYERGRAGAWDYTNFIIITCFGAFTPEDQMQRSQRNYCASLADSQMD